MWIADMDFACPKEIIDPMRERVEQGIFGYTDTPDELTQILKDRIKLRSGWDIEEEWVVWVPGAVVALNLACKAVLSPGEISPGDKTALHAKFNATTAPGTQTTHSSSMSHPERNLILSFNI